MKRYFALMAVCIVLAGCARSQSPATDPFFGRTSIPPPGTGSATGGGMDKYYQSPPVVQLPAGTQPGPQPPGVTLPTSPPATTPGPAAMTPGWSTTPQSPRPTSTLPGASLPAARSGGVSAPIPSGGNTYNYGDRFPRPAAEPGPSGGIAARSPASTPPATTSAANPCPSAANPCPPIIVCPPVYVCPPACIVGQEDRVVDIGDLPCPQY
jgi:hypothetical protein